MNTHETLEERVTEQTHRLLDDMSQSPEERLAALRCQWRRCKALQLGKLCALLVAEGKLVKRAIANHEATEKAAMAEAGFASPADYFAKQVAWRNVTRELYAKEA